MFTDYIADDEEWDHQPCPHSEHEPPKHRVYRPGKHEHRCPGCGHVTTIRIPLRYMDGLIEGTHTGRFSAALPNLPR